MLVRCLGSLRGHSCRYGGGDRHLDGAEEFLDGVRNARGSSFHAFEYVIRRVRHYGRAVADNLDGFDFVQIQVLEGDGEDERGRRRSRAIRTARFELLLCYRHIVESVRIGRGWRDGLRAADAVYVHTAAHRAVATGLTPRIRPVAIVSYRAIEVMNYPTFKLFV